MTVVRKLMLLVLSGAVNFALSGCKADNSLSGDFQSILHSVSVTSVYPVNGANWNQYIKVSDYSKSLYAQTDTACVGTEVKKNDCIHAGELKQFIPAGFDSCDGMTAADSKSAFNWVCIDEGSTIRFVSMGFKGSAGLANLISNLDWVDMQVYLFNGAERVGASTAEKWWSNTIEALPASSAALPEILSDSGKIYVLESDANVTGFNIDADGIGLVVMPGVRMTYADTATDSCNRSTGEVAGAGITCMVSVGSNKYVWIEGIFDGDVSPQPDIAILFYDAKYSVLRNIEVRRPIDDGISLSSSSAIRMENARVKTDRIFAQAIHVNGTNWSSFNNIEIADSLAGLYLTNAANNTFQNIKIHNQSFHGVDMQGAGNQGNVFVNLLSAGVQYYNFYSSGASHNTLSHMTAAFAGSNINLESTEDTTINQVVSLHAGYGLNETTNSKYNVLSQVVFGDNDWGILSWNGADNTKVTNNFIFAASSTADCYSTGANPGFAAWTCANAGASVAHLVSVTSLETSIKGKVVTDDSANSSDSSGAISYAATVDFWSFDNFFRLIAKDGTWGNLNSTKNQCNGACRIWDFGLSETDTILKNTSSDGATSVLAVNGENCPGHVYTELTDNTTIPYFYGINGVEAMGDGSGDDDGRCEVGEKCVNRFLVNAVEIANDNFGDDDGLCESSEACVFSSNFGVYQGSGDYETRTCSYLNSAALYVQDVKMYFYPNN